MIEMSDIMRELACAVRQKNFEAADEAITVIGSRFGHSGAIARGRYDAMDREPVQLDVPNIVTIHDLPSRDGIEIVIGSCGEHQWKPAA